MTLRADRYVALDDIDREVLEALQRNGRLTNQALAERVRLSASACLARVRRMERLGVIAGYYAEIAVELLQPAMTVFAELTLRKHLISELDEFDRSIDQIPAIIEAHRISGSYDYLLKAIVTDLREWREIAHLLLQEDKGVEKMVIHISYDEIKTRGAPSRMRR